MPPWPAQASSECIFCVYKRTFTRPSISRPAAHQHLKPSLRRNLSVRRTWLPDQREAGEDKKTFRKTPLRGESRDNRHEFRGQKKSQVTKRDKLPSPPEVGAAILRQLETLEHQIAAKRATGEDGHSTIATLDPDNKHWKSFEADIRHLIEEGTKTLRKNSFNTQRWELYQKLYRAQMPRKDSSLMPRADVARYLEFAYFDHVLHANKQTVSETPLFDPVAEYTDLRYPTEWYAAARATQRQIHLHVGPTNSGKTYNALKRLEEAGNGYYCGPLRLLAHEVYARFQAKGIPCHLITGDDVRTDSSEDVKLRSSTVEMVDTNSRVEVAVIDEIQMMAHEERGWAWTRAFLGSNAKEVHLCGETRVIPLVRELSASMGDVLHIHNYERLSPLKVMSKSLNGNLKLLRKGDCVVAFSIIGIHALKKEIEKETGRRVAIVYGSLPPETRAAQAELFNDPDNDYDFLVASDAIGMGLNLAVKRMIFESVYKHNGRMREVLSIPQIKQIAGRAGRYRIAKQGANKDMKKDGEVSPAPQAVGLVTCMEEADLPIIQEALRTEPEPIKAAGLLPPAEFIEEYAARLPKGLPFEYVFQRVCDVAKMHPRFSLSEVKSQTEIAKVLDSVQNLTTKDRLCFSSSPASTRKQQDVKLLTAYGKCVAEGKPVTCVDIPEIPLEMLDQPISGQREYLQELESLHSSLILYLWLSYRFLGIFKDREQATYAKSLTEQRINDTLTKFSHSTQLKERIKQLKKQQIKDSKILSELGPSAENATQPILLNDEPSTAETPLEPAIALREDPASQDLSAEPSDRDTTSRADSLDSGVSDSTQLDADLLEPFPRPDQRSADITIETEEVKIVKKPGKLIFEKDANLLRTSRWAKSAALSTHLSAKGHTSDLPPEDDTARAQGRQFETTGGS